MGNGQSHKPRVGLLLVHGIGEQEPGAFLGEFRDGFGRLLGADRVTDVVRQDPVEPLRCIYAAEIELDDRMLMLYEVHWADLITPEMARGSFDPMQLFLLAWFPWFNKQWQLPGFDKYSKGEVTSWTLRLVPLSVLFFLGYVGLKAIPHFVRARATIEVVTDRCRRRMTRWRTRYRSDHLQVIDEFAKENERRLLRLWVEGKPERDRERLEQAVMRTWLDMLMDAFAGDVTNFITSMAKLPRLREDLVVARAFGGKVPTDALTASLPQDLVESFVDAPRREGDVMQLADRAKARFERTAWVATMQDGCTEIQVLAHSLGTLVAYHAMNGVQLSPEIAAREETGAATLTRFHTIGSPLEKIHFFWPRLVASRGDKPSLCGQGPESRAVVIGVHPDFQWTNYYSVSDKVSGALRRFQGWRGIANRRLAGLGGVLSAHVAYKQSADFLRALAEQLGVAVAPQRGGWLRSALGWTWSVSQSLLLPLMATTVCLLGVAFLAGFAAAVAAIFTGLISVVGYGLYWLFTGTGGSLWYGRFFFWSTAFFFVLSAMFIALYVPAWAKSAACVSVGRWWRNLGVAHQLWPKRPNPSFHRICAKSRAGR